MRKREADEANWRFEPDEERSVDGNLGYGAKIEFEEEDAVKVSGRDARRGRVSVESGVICADKPGPGLDIGEVGLNVGGMDSGFCGWRASMVVVVAGSKASSTE